MTTSNVIRIFSLDYIYGKGIDVVKTIDITVFRNILFYRAWWPFKF